MINHDEQTIQDTARMYDDCTEKPAVLWNVACASPGHPVDMNRMTIVGGIPADKV